jgi:hypothetical protein
VSKHSTKRQINAILIAPITSQHIVAMPIVNQPTSPAPVVTDFSAPVDHSPLSKFTQDELTGDVHSPFILQSILDNALAETNNRSSLASFAELTTQHQGNNPDLVTTNHTAPSTALPLTEQRQRKNDLELMLVKYLRDHPRFFERHQSALQDILLPSTTHPEVLLSLWEKQRENLQQRIHTLTEQANAQSARLDAFNQRLQNIHRLQCNLLLCPSLADMIACFRTQCEARIGYTPLLWWWDLPHDKDSTATFLRLPVASPALIAFAETAPMLGFLPAYAQTAPALAEYLPQEGEWAMVLPLVPPVRVDTERTVRGLLVFMVSPSPDQENASDAMIFEEKWLASKFAEWSARLLEGQWLRESARGH